ncbi:molybdopterin oxidoreductase [Duganella sp. Leaf126]|uniref:circularly permuted type 2 ATP-grasp protein n=1 Tax=Duganella sp. Leaf126 TaxID=1736266 RepID=UPI0006F2F6F6|nr:circularly permuted type 2 ATP-grasp protein [Duganella sp. Leaf126]KQQ40091.1 molybdopterin oxidoreductase [Duganella sp. Leaf126]
MPSSLLAHYLAAPDSYDEMLDAGRAPRPHWRAMLDNLGGEAPGMMRQRNEMVQRQVRENGVTYNVPADRDGRQRPWDLNALPLILPPDDWNLIEAAVIQRATLLNRILLDVYGDQQMLREGLLPPALVHGHAGFLRPCHGIRHHDDVALHAYAVDLARAPDGRWWVMADRTQAPSGAGYALENRAIISPTFPDLLRELKVQPLTGFFRTMHDSLQHWGRACAASGDRPAPLRDGDVPLIVLLTAGPATASYYEQAYLARHLGLALVEGGDLTVRDGVVYLKTLAGLQRVHVIMRRVDDEACDPLELDSSMLGVAGLVQAAQRGNVVVANSLGSSLLESGALLGFLPALSRRLLGEPLKMPSVATWWCGEPAALAAVIEKLDRLVIKPSFSQRPQSAVFGRDLDGTARDAFIAGLRANPGNFIAQEVVRLSQAPVWKGGITSGLQARAIGLRVFACATPNGYVVMPGGLTRVATGPDARVLTMQMGGASKDTWVQGRARVDRHRPQQASISSDNLVREDTNLSSRVAENLLWYGRHAERCDNTGRLLRVALHILFNVRFDQRGAEWPTVEALCIEFGLLDAGTKRAATGAAKAAAATVFSDAEIESALLLAVVSPDVPGLALQQRQLHRVASQLHERFSVDNWRALNRMVQPAVHPGERPSQSAAMTILDDAAAALMMLSGFSLDGMTRDLGWRFMSVGRRLERLQFQCEVLQRALAMDHDGNLEWLLELSDSIITYRARYRAQPEWLPVLDLLLCDESNPRSVLFQIDGILGTLRHISYTHGPCGAHLLAPFRDELGALTPAADLAHGNTTLGALLKRIHAASAALSEHISVQFFSYTDNGLQGKRTA